MISMRTKRDELRALNEAIQYPKFSSPRVDLRLRNEQFYSILSKHKMCVIPDPAIRSVDGLPQFEIVETVPLSPYEQMLREKNFKKDSSKRIQKMSINAILDERSLGGQKANLSLRDLDRQLNDFQLYQARRKRKNFPVLHKPGFESKSLAVTTEKINEARSKEKHLSQSDSYFLGKFMNKLIERKYQSMVKLPTSLNGSQKGSFGASGYEGAAGSLNNTCYSNNFPDSATNLSISQNPFSQLNID